MKGNFSYCNVLTHTRQCPIWQGNPIHWDRAAQLVLGDEILKLHITDTATIGWGGGVIQESKGYIQGTVA